MTRVWAVIILTLAAAACDAAQSPKLEPAPAEAASDPALLAYAGKSYSDFVVGAGARYSPEALGLSAGDRARLWRGMAASQVGALVSGGGAEALVFRGCATEGCAAGASVVAVDAATGGVFAGVRDVGGADILARDERMLALLEATSTNGEWDGVSEASPQPAAATIQP